MWRKIVVFHQQPEPEPQCVHGVACKSPCPAGLCHPPHKRQKRVVPAKLDAHSWPSELWATKHHESLEPATVGVVHSIAMSTSSDCQISYPGGLSNRNLPPHSSGDWRSKTKVPLELVLGETSLPGLQMATPSHTLPWLPLCVQSSLGLFLYDISPTGFGSTLTTSFNSNQLSIDSIPKYHIGHQGYNLWIWRRHNSIHISSNRELMLR